MPSKYAKFKGKLDPWQPEPSYQERIDKEKLQYAKLSPTELAQAFMLHDDAKDKAEEIIKGMNLKIEALSQLIVTALEGSDLQSIELQSGMKCSLDIKPYVSVIDSVEAHASYEAWLRTAKIKKLLTLNMQRRDALIKEDLEAGRPTPKWAKVFLKTRAKLTGKSKENSNGGNGDE